MSASRNRLTSALRRIVKTDPEVRSLLTAAESKGGKPGAAGVGSSTEAQQAQVCCDGSIGDANPGTSERDPADGDQDGLNPDDPADLSGLDGGCLTGVTNCDTGEAICFCGDDWLPPDGWDSPTDPPPEVAYEDGFYWTVSFGTGKGSTPKRAAADEGPGHCACLESDGEWQLYDTALSPAQSGAGCDTCGRRRGQEIVKLECTGIHLNEIYCTEVPIAESWPADSCVNLAIKGGKIVGSKYDPENDGSYSTPMTEIHVCDGANSMYLAPSATGGWKSIDSTRTSGYLYGKGFELIAHIDGNEYSDPGV